MVKVGGNTFESIRCSEDAPFEPLGKGQRICIGRHLDALRRETEKQSLPGGQTQKPKSKNSDRLLRPAGKTPTLGNLC